MYFLVDRYERIFSANSSWRTIGMMRVSIHSTHTAYRYCLYLYYIYYVPVGYRSYRRGINYSARTMGYDDAAEFKEAASS
jgi:hypothetical protein